jgi:UDP-glucose 4-epimerase
MTDALSGATTLVTGGAGFVGRHLVDALAEDTDVRVLDDCSTGTASHVPETVEFYEADVRDDALDTAMTDVDVVFHQAGLSSVPESLSDPLASHGRNTTGTLSVLEAARRNDARVVLASSAAVYGQPSSLPVSEDDSKDPTSPYGVDKLAADHYTRVYADRYDLPTVCLRYFNVYGPGQTSSAAGVVTTFIERATAGRPLVVHGDGSQTRDFVHVTDVVQANLLTARTDATGEAFNVGTGTAVPVEQLAAVVRAAVDRPVPIERAGARDGDIQHSRADLSRARRLLEFDPQVTLREGIRALADNRPPEPDATVR